jgi:hypothetical protein
MIVNHLHSLQLRLSNERARMRSSTGTEKEIRAVWVTQIEREIAAEQEFLELDASTDALSEDELLTALFEG